MSPPTGKTSREHVLPNRVKLRALRDQYMSDMAATSYDEVRNKFLEELKSKRGRDDSESPRERGAGIWNSAFAAKGRMLRSSIVLLAEFFDVASGELIAEPEPENFPKDGEVKPMPELAIEPVVNTLIAYYQHSPKLGIQTRNLCQQLVELIQRHLHVPIADLIREGHPPEVARLCEALQQVARVEPTIHALMLQISRMNSQPRPTASRVAKPVVRGDQNQVVTVQGDIHIPNGSLFNNQHTFNSDTQNNFNGPINIDNSPNSFNIGMRNRGKKRSSDS